ncbi:MAG: HAD-IA family hydrolase [Alphaproteobacteria bacterium]|jgi:phosphoglycolate phosphatase|nr:HAD-IA family hydrolase [Rhodospirillaceae bacterium]MBT6512239.1 HAD-IA family hydrolase [Rhodospirillaceae bacterium]MBT7614227.1 HAD-IA family hydrolase [Rhodospirillaceae bacterium]MBT7647679.1 HAD-IA family hydrolase [Rhodospirillaceae bacterium]MDG2481221.1 HAD-IA family hydrolase [Alphaproteobacteria bacterium]
MNGVHLVLFDCDGTLVDSQFGICTAMTRAFELQGREAPSRAMILGGVGLSIDVAIRRLDPTLDEASVALVAQDYKAAFFALRQMPDHAAREPMYPGMADLVCSLHDHGVLMGVATGKSMRGLNYILDLYGLKKRFVTLQTPDNAPGKPHPGMILQAMAEVGANPAATVMIGDTSYDLEMARSAGVHALGVDWGYHPVAMLQEAGANAIAGDAAHLQALIGGALGIELA